MNDLRAGYFLVNIFEFLFLVYSTFVLLTTMSINRMMQCVFSSLFVLKNVNNKK